jgi:hypothetical protein
MFEHRPLVSAVASIVADSVSFSVAPTEIFDPLALFRRGEEGFYNDIQTYSTSYFTDTAGTDPAVLEDTIGLVLDQSQGGVARRNLLQYTEEFDDAYWTKGNVTVTANAATAPNGTLTADKIIEDTENASHFVGRQGAGFISGALHKYSIFAQKGERDFIVLLPIVGGGNAAAWFNLNAGVVGAKQANCVSSEITDVGGGWFRCSMSWVTTGSTVNVIAAPSNANNVLNYTGDGTSGIFIWGAQLELGDTATEYQKITTGLNGEWTPGNHLTQATAGARPKLSARYNLLERTEEFDNAYWQKVTSVVTANTTTAPDGTSTADTCTAGSVRRLTSPLPNGSYRAVMHFKKSAASTVKLIAETGGAFSNRIEYTVNLDEGSVSVVLFGTYSGSAVLTPVSNGFYQLIADFSTGTKGGTGGIWFIPVLVDTTILWGADLRLASDTDQPAYQRVTTATDYDSEGFDPYLQFDQVDDALTATIPAITGGTLVLATRQGIWIDDDINADAGTFSIGPTTYTGGPAGLLSVIGNKLIGPPQLIDRQLTTSERNAWIQWFQNRGAGALYDSSAISWDSATDTYGGIYA